MPVGKAVDKCKELPSNLYGLLVLLLFSGLDSMNGTNALCGFVMLLTRAFIALWKLLAIGRKEVPGILASTAGVARLATLPTALE